MNPLLLFVLLSNHMTKLTQYSIDANNERRSDIHRFMKESWSVISVNDVTITSLWMTQCCMTMYACAYVLVQGYGIFSMLTVGIPNPNYFIEMLLTLFRCIFVSQFCCQMRETTYCQFRTMCYELRNHLLPPLMSPLPRGWLCSLFYYAIFFENMNC